MTARGASRRAPSVFLVTDPRWPLARLEEVIEAAGGALAPGALAIQVRDKSAAPVDLARTVERLRRVTVRTGALLVVNAATSEALRVAVDGGADGAHVPCRPERISDARTLLGPSAWISTPAHADEDASIAESAGATGVLVSPIFESPGKGPARGVEALVAARAYAAELVLVALGGVDASRAATCAAAGADGVAVIRALLDARDPAATARALAAPFQGRANQRARG
jgi:thiamine-phosphate pyrophosphorylase